MRMLYLAALLSTLGISTGCAHALDQPGQTRGSGVHADPALSAAAYKRALEADPSDGKARLDYARLLSRQGKYAAAEAHFLIVLERQPANLEAMTARAYNHVWSDRFDLAEQQFRQALEAAPNSYAVKKGLAVAYLCSGRAPEALEVFRTLHARHPGDLEVLAAIEAVQADALAGHTTNHGQKVHRHGAWF